MYIQNPFRFGSGVVPYKLYIGNKGDVITTSTILATYLRDKDNINTSYESDDIITFNIDAKDNIYAELLVQYTINTSAFSTDNDITYFIDLNGGITFTYQTSFQGAGTGNSMKLWYSPSAKIWGANNQDRCFRNRTANFKLIYAPANPQIGKLTATTQSFNLLTTGIEIFVHEDAETIDGGNPDGNIVDVRDNKSGVITYVDDFSIPDAVDDLSTSSITTTTVDLDFSTPSSTNTILKYEVWVDGAFWDWVTATGGTVTGLTTGTNYDIKIKTADDRYNLSVLSNNVNFTTN